LSKVLTGQEFLEVAFIKSGQGAKKIAIGYIKGGKNEKATS
jgi:hypothetical protein